MANDARTNRPNANPLGASSLHDQEAEDAAAGRNSIPPTFLARYMSKRPLPEPYSPKCLEEEVLSESPHSPGPTPMSILGSARLPSNGMEVARVCHLATVGTARPDGGGRHAPLFASLLFGTLCERITQPLEFIEG